MKAKKYEYSRVLQLDYGQGWEDECTYTANSTFALSKETLTEKKDDIKAYRENCPQYARRVINRRTPIKQS
jgi:hypothetical protein